MKLYLQEIFYTLSATLLIFTLMELIHPGIVLAYININHVLLFWLILVIVLIVKPNKIYER